MKEIATGIPANSSAVEPPRSSTEAICQDMLDVSGNATASGRRNGVVPQADVGRGQPVHAENEFDGEEGEPERKRSERPPLGSYQRLDVDGAGAVAGNRDKQPVPDEIETTDKPDDVAEPFQQPCGAQWQGAQDNVDADMLALAQQPGRHQQRHKVKDIFGELVADRNAAAADVARQNVEADYQAHEQEQRARRDDE